MTKVPQIHLTYETSGWVKVQSGNALPATYDFVKANARFMDRVCFGTEPVANMGSLAVKIDRLPKLIAHASQHGVKVFWKRGAELVEAVA